MLLTDDKFFNDPEFREMLKAYEEAASKGMPPFFDADDLIDIADYYRLTDQMDKAMEVAQNAIDLFPNATLPNVFMARNALQNDNLKEAEYYVSMIEAEDDPDYIYIKAELLIYQYKLEEAEQLLEAKFHELTNDDNGWFIKDVANLYLDYGEYERGYTWMMRYCDVKDDDYKELLGRALYGTWKLEECESIFTELADKYPFDKKYWKVLAEAQLSQNKFDEAINSSEYAIAIDPDDPVPHGIKASALMGKGNWEEAVKFFKTALSHAQYDCSGYIQLATCLINTNEFKEALEWLEKALKESGNAREYAGAIYHQMALCQGALGNNEEAKKLLESKRTVTVQEAVEAVGISRSSFYKYKDDIFPFREKTKGQNITFILQMDDEPGLLSGVLKTIAYYHGNILTVHQSIPINGIASLTLSVQILPAQGDAEAMVAEIEHIEGVHYLKILGRE